MQYRSLQLNVENYPEINRFFALVFNNIDKMPALDKLIIEATKDAPMPVEFVDKKSMLHDGSHYTKVEIDSDGKEKLNQFIQVVWEDKSCIYIFYVLIFELCNASNSFFNVFSNDYINYPNFSNRDDYAKAKEYAEYTGSSLVCTQVMSEIFSNPQVAELFNSNGFPITQDQINTFTNAIFGTFDSYWTCVNTNGHAEYYRTQYDMFRKQKDYKMRKQLQEETRKLELEQMITTRFEKENKITISPCNELKEPKEVKKNIKAIDSLNEMESFGFKAANEWLPYLRSCLPFSGANNIDFNRGYSEGLKQRNIQGLYLQLNKQEAAEVEDFLKSLFAPVSGNRHTIS